MQAAARVINISRGFCFWLQKFQLQRAIFEAQSFAFCVQNKPTLITTTTRHVDFTQKLPTFHTHYCIIPRLRHFKTCPPPHFQRFVGHRSYNRLRAASVTVQCVARARPPRVRYRAMRAAAVVVQTATRRRQARRRYEASGTMARWLQRVHRGRWAGQQHQTCGGSSIVCAHTRIRTLTDVDIRAALKYNFQRSNLYPYTKRKYTT